MSGPEIQRAADDIEYLEASWHAVLDREKAIEDDRKLIQSGNVSTGAIGIGFAPAASKTRRCSRTGTNWVVIPRFTILMVGPTQADVRSLSDGGCSRELLKTISPIRMAIMSGKCYGSDLLYIKETQQSIDEVDKTIDTAEPLITSFVRRYNIEFPDGKIHLESLKKHDVHLANIKPELIPAFVTGIDLDKERLPILVANATSYRERRLRFLNTIQAVAMLANDKRLRDLAANFGGKEHPFNSHGQDIGLRPGAQASKSGRNGIGHPYIPDARSRC